MMSDFRQYKAGYTVANLRRYPIRRFIAFASALELKVLAPVRYISCISGKGRGRQVIAVARTADLIIMMLDATKKEIQKYEHV